MISCFTCFLRQAHSCRYVMQRRCDGISSATSDMLAIHAGGGRGRPAREVLENPGAEHFILFQIGLVRTRSWSWAAMVSTQTSSGAVPT